jgi:hypothetical protein
LEIRVDAGTRTGFVEDHQGRGGPGSPCGDGIRHPLQIATDRRGQAQQFVEQRLVAAHHEWPIRVHVAPQPFSLIGGRRSIAGSLRTTVPGTRNDDNEQ